jgi:hypothetical protein
VVSRLTSAPSPSVASLIASPASAPLASITAVAPTSRATSSRDGRKSTAMIVVQPVAQAAMIAASPTVPVAIA